MKSGLRDRNNVIHVTLPSGGLVVSMKSGLRDRNNVSDSVRRVLGPYSLNEVRS